MYSDVASPGVEKGPPETMKKYAAGSMSTSEKMLYGGLMKCGMYILSPPLSLLFICPYFLFAPSSSFCFFLIHLSALPSSCSVPPFRPPLLAMYPILAFIPFSLPFLLPRLLPLLPSPLFQYNTSIQLGPQTPHLPPSATAHTCTVPVTATLDFEDTTDKYHQLQ